MIYECMIRIDDGDDGDQRSTVTMQADGDLGILIAACIVAQRSSLDGGQYVLPELVIDIAHHVMDDLYFGEDDSDLTDLDRLNCEAMQVINDLHNRFLSLKRVRRG